MMRKIVMRDEYSKQIALHCMTCGATYAFETDEKNGYITCRKCNRVYRGGKEELMSLNEALLEEEQEQLIDEVRNNVEKEFKKMFKNIKIKL